MFFLINRTEFTFKPFHDEIIKKLQDMADCKNDKPNLLLNLPVGCVSGDTKIRINRRKGISREIPIKKAYEHFNHIGNKRYFWKNDLPFYTRSIYDNHICLKEVEDIVYSGKKQVYLLELEDGKSLKATAEHKILTDKGYVELINLKIGQNVAVDNLEKRGKKEKQPKVRDIHYVLVGRKHPYAQYVGHDTWRIEPHRAIYEAYINGLTLEEYKKSCYEGKNLKFINPKEYHIHHKDGNHYNNEISNLECLPVKEHLKIHGNSDHFGQGQIDYVKVKKITKLGIEDTYDLTLKPNGQEPNFSANNIMIHNSGKSLITELFITWTFARNPSVKHLYVSHSELLITKLSRETLEIIESPYWQSLFKHPLDQKSSTQYNFQDAGTRSGMTAAPIGSALTGIDAGNPAIDGFNGSLLIDDPLDVSNANSEVLLNECIRNYTDKLKTRLRTSHTPIILIMQRLSTNDLAQYVIDAESDEWDVVTIKAYDEENRKSFWEEKFPISKLEQIKIRTPELYYSQYQQEPRATGGSLFTRDMFQTDALPEFFDFTAIMADTAYRGTERNDWTVFMAVGKANDRFYILDIRKARVNSDKIVEYFLPFMLKWSKRDDFIGCYIEPKGHGIFLNQYFNQQGIITQSETTLKDFYKDRKRDKVIRANVVLPDIYNNKVTFNADMDQSIVQDCISECVEFPDGRHDDMVDCVIDGAKLVYKHIPSILEVL